MTLPEAIAELRSVTLTAEQWTGDDFAENPTRVDEAIAVILNATLAGEMLPRRTEQ
jgi:hypothetical protein